MIHHRSWKVEHYVAGGRKYPWHCNQCPCKTIFWFFYPHPDCDLVDLESDTGIGWWTNTENRSRKLP